MRQHPSRRWRLHRRCNRCGPAGAAFGRAGRGSTPRSPTAAATWTRLRPSVHARALVDKALLDVWVGASASWDQAEQALAIAREVDDAALLARALTASAFAPGMRITPRSRSHPSPRRLAPTRALGDLWRLSQILSYQAFVAVVAVIRSRRVRRPKKGANSRTPSVIKSARGSVTWAWGLRCLCRENWLKL